jgi:hypothetical protein
MQFGGFFNFDACKIQRGRPGLLTRNHNPAVEELNLTQMEMRRQDIDDIMNFKTDNNRSG